MPCVYAPWLQIFRRHSLHRYCFHFHHVTFRDRPCEINVFLCISPECLFSFFLYLLTAFFMSPLLSSSPSLGSVHHQKERKAAGLLKLLSGAAAKKKPRSPPSSPPTHDPSAAGQGAVATDLVHHPLHHHHHARSGSCPMASQGRAGSCPIESDMAGAIGLEPLHRKSGSLDTNFPRSPPATRAGSALMVLRPEPKPLSRERWAHALSIRQQKCPHQSR